MSMYLIGLFLQKENFLFFHLSYFQYSFHVSPSDVFHVDKGVVNDDVPLYITALIIK